MKEISNILYDSTSLDENSKQTYHLKNIKDYRYLNKSSCISRNDVKDEDCY